MSRHARSPEEIQTLFIAAIGNHDLDGLMALYDEDAVMVPSPGAAPVRGLALIREALAGLLLLEPEDAALETIYCLRHDELALMRSAWRFTGTGPDGRRSLISGSGTEVMRRLPDGRWVQILDNPWGGDPLS